MRPPGPDIVLVTGPSGAGRTTAIRALEDLGFEAIDNLPISLLPRLTDGKPLEKPLAIGVDARTRDFSADGLLAAMAAMPEAYLASLLYVDCSLDTLLQRFSETRRRHPLAEDESVRAGIARELALLAPLHEAADLLIDTTEYSPHMLKADIVHWFGADLGGALSIVVQSFAFKRGTPREADMIQDMRFLRNPHWEPKLRVEDGRHPDVADFIRQDPVWATFFETFLDFTLLLLPAYKAEGKSYLTMAFGCTGGQHRSVFTAETLAKALAERDWQVSIRHRELERLGAIKDTIRPGVGGS